MFETTKPTSEEDIKLIAQEIERLREVITQYEKDKFAAYLLTCKQMKVPNVYYPTRYSTFSYSVGSRIAPFSCVHNNNKCKRKYLPIVDSWKTNKNAKSTHYMLYESTYNSFIHESLKDDDMGEFEIVQK